MALILTLTSLGCADDRLRELGYTLDFGAPPGSDAVEPDATEPCDPPFISIDDVQRSVASDLSTRPSQDRRFLRYLQLAARSNLGVCAEQLDRDRAAIGKQVNSLSQRSEIVPAVVLGPGGTLLRIDIRDYGWDRPVSVGSESYSDGWEAVIAASPFAVALEGPAASFVAAEAQSSVAVLSVAAFIGATSSAPLYYSLLGVADTLGALRASVGLPRQLDPLGDGAVRSATQLSRVLRSAGNFRVVDRYATSTGTAGSYWEALLVNTGRFLANPLRVQPDVQRLITFTLPNDLIAFAVTDASGARIGVPEGVLDTNRDDFTATVQSSCTNCHANGIIPLEDTVGRLVSENPESFPEEVVAAYANGPTPEQRLEIFAADSEAYAQALVRSGAESTGPDPISFQALFFATNVQLPAAAAELFVEPEVLKASLADLDPGLGTLRFGLDLTRADFGALYSGALCDLHGSSENRPRSSECDAP